MSFDLHGFDKEVDSSKVSIKITSHHPLLKLAKALPWETLLDIVLPDLKRTEKRLWWRGRPLRVRIHLGIYLLQQMFDLTDRQAEYFLKDNAAFQLLCGYSIVPKWHTLDHTKIEEFRASFKYPHILWITLWKEFGNTPRLSTIPRLLTNCSKNEQFVFFLYLSMSYA